MTDSFSDVPAHSRRVKRKITFDVLSNQRPFGRFHNHDTAIGFYMTGVVGSPLGFVTVYAENGRNEHTRFDFIHNRRLYMQTIYARFTERGVIAKAYQFARKVVSGAIRPKGATP